MKTFLVRAFILLGVASFLASCETDIDVTAEWKDITVVYGLISQNDSVHYIKINKAFLGDGNAYTYAQIADSSSYGTNIEVTLVEKSITGSTRTFQCDTTTIYNKEPGVFYYPQQVVYKAAFKIPSDINEKQYTYHLEIRNKLTGKVVKAQTPLVKDFSIDTPNPGVTKIEFISENNQRIKWYSAIDGRRYNVTIRIWFDEVFNLYDTIPRYIDWDFSSVKASSIVESELLEILYDPQNLYPICKSLIPYKDDRENSVTSRLIDKAEFRFAVAGDELNTYMEVNEPSSDLLQEKAEYTNIQNGYGLFSCRYTKTLSVPIGTRTEERLIAEDIKFVDRIGN